MAKKSKKSSVKKSNTKNVVSQELVVRVHQPEVPTLQDIIEPIHEGKKYSIEKTPFTIRQILSLVSPTPEKNIYSRPGKGGQKFSYVTGNFVEKKLNYVFGFLWDFDVVEQGREGDFIWVKGKLTAKLTNGTEISKTQFGRSEVKYLKDKPHKPENMLDYGNDLKSAATDCLKKCASLLGIASDVYGKQEYKQEANIDVKSEIATIERVSGPDGDPVILCKGCDEIIDDQVAGFSKKIYGKPLCRECQKTAKKK